MPARDIDILAIGGIDRDLVLKVPSIPGHDEKIGGEFMGWLSGGPVGNMACAASQLGVQVHAVCQVGDDEGGGQFLADYRSFGVDTTLCDVLPDTTTSFTVILIDPTGEKVIIYVSTHPVTYDLVRIGAALERTKIMFMLPHPEHFPTLAKLARDRGARVMTDIEPRGDDDQARLASVLSLADIASFNQFGVRSWTGEEPSLPLARKLLDLGPATILFSLGARGAIGAAGDEALYCEGIQVDVVDTTGAGDTFHGAFAASVLRGWPLARGLAYANAAGALSVTALGPRGCLPTHAQVQAFLAAQTPPSGQQTG